MFGLNEQPQGPKWDLGNVEQAFMLSEGPFKAPAISYTLKLKKPSEVRWPMKISKLHLLCAALFREGLLTSEAVLFRAIHLNRLFDVFPFFVQFQKVDATVGTHDDGSIGHDERR